MKHTPLHNMIMYGAATVGTKGQLVIPADARADIGIEPGDKVMIMGIKEHGILTVWPMQSMETMLQEMSTKIETIRGAVNEEKENKT